MSLTSDYSFGTITVTQGQTAFTGNGGTAWRGRNFRDGDRVIIQGLTGVIKGVNEPGQPITSDTSGEFYEPWPGESGTFNYRMSYLSNDSRMSAAVQEMLSAIASGNITAIGALQGVENTFIRFTGAGTVELVDGAELTNGVKFDAYAPTLPDLAQYDNQAKDFTVLVGDVGDGRSAIYVKKSNTIGDWFDPAYLTGPVGPMAPINVGDTITTAPGTDANVENVGTPTAPILEFSIPAGKGFYNKGDYASATAYTEGDVIQYNGSSWIAKQATTGNPPPVLPVTSNANWQLLAQMGSGGDMYKATYDPTNQNKDVFSSLVAYDIAQTKTEAEKGQARANIGAGVLAGYRNKIINGDFSIWQRGQSFTVNAGAAVYTADRWLVFNTTNQTATVTRFTFPNGDQENSALAASFSAAPTTGNIFFLHRIEGAKTLTGRQATITAKITGPTTINNASFGLNRKLNAATTQGDIALASIPNFTSNGNFIKKTATFNIPNISVSGALSGDYLECVIKLEPRVSGTYAIARASLVEGDATKDADPFPPRHIQEELSLCQRYYQIQKIFAFLLAGSNGEQSSISFPVRPIMRGNPTANLVPTYVGNGQNFRVAAAFNSACYCLYQAINIGNCEVQGDVIFESEL